MAVTFLGSMTGSGTFTSASTWAYANLRDASGSAPTLQQGDLIVCTYVHSMATTASRTLAQMTPTGFAAITGLASSVQANDNNAVSLGVFYLFMGATPDTQIEVAAAAAGTNSFTFIVEAWRGVDQTTPFGGVTPTTASSANSGLADPPSVTTPASPTGCVVCGGFGAAVASAAVFTNTGATPYDTTTNWFKSDIQNTSTNRSVAGMGAKSGLAISTAFNAAITGSNATNTGSWAAVSFVIAPSSGTTVALTGQSLTGAVGSLLAAASLALSGGALSSSQGSVQQGAPLTGQALAAAQGSVSPNVTIALTGQALSVGQGTVVGGQPVTGQSASVAQGSAAPTTSVALTGQSLSIARGTVAPTNTEALSGQSVSVAQGTLTPVIAEALSGQGLSVARGSLAPTTSPALSGQSVVVAAGSVSPTISLALAGQSLIVSQGTVTASTGSNVTAALTGQAVSAAIGAVIPTLTTTLSGQALSAVQGSLVPAYALMIGGQALNATQGLFQAPLNITVAITGLGLGVPLGSLTALIEGPYKFWRQPALVGRRTNPGRSR